MSRRGRRALRGPVAIDSGTDMTVDGEDAVIVRENRVPAILGGERGAREHSPGRYTEPRWQTHRDCRWPDRKQSISDSARVPLMIDVHGGAGGSDG
jgi:hypothetical protein